MLDILTSKIPIKIDLIPIAGQISDFCQRQEISLRVEILFDIFSDFLSLAKYNPNGLIFSKISLAQNMLNFGADFIPEELLLETFLSS